MPLMITTEGELAAIREPATQADVTSQFKMHHLACNGGQAETTIELIRNEVRHQTVPELQDDLARATTIIKGMKHAEFLTIAHADEAEWIGDREQTKRYEWVGGHEIAQLWPGEPCP